MDLISKNMKLKNWTVKRWEMFKNTHLKEKICMTHKQIDFYASKHPESDVY